MDLSDFCQVCDLAEVKKNWVGSIPFHDGDSQTNVDLVTLSRPNPRLTKLKRSCIKSWPQRTIYRFPQIYKGHENRELLINQIKRCARAFGGQILQTRTSFLQPSGYRLQQVVLTCQRGRTYESTASTPSFAEGKLQASGTSVVTSLLGKLTTAMYCIVEDTYYNFLHSSTPLGTCSGSTPKS